MRILQTIILSSLLLLIASNAYPQKDKSLQNVFIPEGYALDRNQVQYNQPKDFISYIASLGKNKVYLGCFRECNLNSVWFLFLLNHNKYNFFFLDLQMLLKVVFGCVQGRRR
ncbi:hypothetical protein ACMSD4_16855, partial [Bacteroides thetaiotaomicron]